MQNRFLTSDRLVFRFEQTPFYGDRDEGQVLGRTGIAELRLTVQETSEQFCAVVVDQYVFAGEAQDGKEDAFRATYTFLTSAGQGTFVEEEDSWVLDLNLAANLIPKRTADDVVAILSDCVEELAAVAIGPEADYDLSAFDSTAFRVLFKKPQRDRTSGELEVIESSVDFRPRSDENSIVEVSVQIHSATLLVEPGDSDHSMLLANHADSAETVLARLMTITPYFVTATQQDALDFPHALLAWLAEANRIWDNKGCIQILERAHQAVDESDLIHETGASDILNAIRKWHKPSTGELALFIVNDASLAAAAHGGGVTDVRFKYQSGNKIMIIERIVLASSAVQNSRVLAHELGHAFGGVHHDDTPQPVQWQGDDNTILTPSGSVHLLNPDRNTRHNCVSVRHPGITTPGHYCQPNYDL